MSLTTMIFSWVNLFIFIILFEGIFTIYEKCTPIYAKNKLEGKVLKSWRNIRFFASVIISIGFYCFTFSKNLDLNINIKLLINIIGLVLISIGEIIKIVNSIKK